MIVRLIQLLREKEIVSTDGETEGTGDFVVVDLMLVLEERFVLVVLRGKETIFWRGEEVVFSELFWCTFFLPTGGKQSWKKMLKYNGGLFQMSRKIDILFIGWIKRRSYRWGTIRFW